MGRQITLIEMIEDVVKENTLKEEYPIHLDVKGRKLSIGDEVIIAYIAGSKRDKFELKEDVIVNMTNRTVVLKNSRTIDSENKIYLLNKKEI